MSKRPESDKRCKARNSRLGLRCTKPRSHLGDLEVIHMNGAVIWMDEVEPTLQLTPVEELAGWWRDRAEEEIERTVPKAIEYGDTDLRETGQWLAAISGRELSDQDAAEWGVWMYVIGKLGRVTCAMERGELPSDDTLFDLGIYVRMAQRIRHSGNWPGVNLHEESK